jgi:AP-2 complex subunit sigma-1
MAAACPRNLTAALALFPPPTRNTAAWRTPRFILLQNRAGRTRLAKYYVPMEDREKHKLEYEVHRLVVNRDPKHTNFVEVGNAHGPALAAGRAAPPRSQGQSCDRCWACA